MDGEKNTKQNPSGARLNYIEPEIDSRRSRPIFMLIPEA